MTADVTDRIAGELLALLPFYHKRVFRPNEHGITGMKAAQYRTLGILMKSGILPMSELGKRQYISKPYMTVLVDQLIIDGYAERIPDARDRRVINIAITQKGKKHLKQAFSIYKEDVKQLLSSLGPEDLDELLRSLETLSCILSKIPPPEPAKPQEREKGPERQAGGRL
jgi:DNA-binding MarR family transcriptional regulator